MLAAATQAKYNLLDFDQAGLRDFLVESGEKPFRAQQLMKWIYHEGESDFSHMSNLSKALRATLETSTEIRLPRVTHSHQSLDGTWKWLFRLDSGNSIECVFIPEERRGTLCVSSQVGCALDCSFCATAREGFNRNLSTGEIVGQLMLATKLLRDSQPDDPPRITNVVLMGMGEPLANFQNVVRALRLMIDDFAFGLSKRRVTISTSGIVPAMHRLYDAVDVALAVSLHAPNDALRDKLVPINRKYPISQLMDACRAYIDGDRKKHVTFEYVMLDRINDEPEHAYELTKLVQGVPSKINLIPFNPFPQSGYTCSSKTRIDRFRKILCDAGLVAVTRKTRGDDISAACGQLAGKVQDKSRRALKFSELRFGEIGK
ncbi:MAG: 23S rRNA (adenine(2503)-C(2))-methyltransferase RlmN [Pseudomonadota bacterium]